VSGIEPVRGAFFSPPEAPPGETAAPPYDIITPEGHRRLLERNPYNVVRFTLGDEPGKEGDFQGADAVLSRLVAEGIIKVDPQPAFYVYEVRFPGAARREPFLGLVGAVSVRAKVLPHERTMGAVKEGRLRALEGTRANLGLVLLACRDGGRLTEVLQRGRERLRAEAEVRAGEVHAVWNLECELWEEAKAVLDPLPLIIADGHHRFQTAQYYASLHPEDPAAQRVLVVVAGMGSRSGLQILPTHRVVRFPSVNEAAAWAADLVAAFDMCAPEEADLTVYSPRMPEGVALRVSVPPDCGSLIAYLHELWLDRLREPVRVRAAHDLPEEPGQLCVRESVVVLRVRAVRPEELERTVQRGEVLPPKSTFFYPKVYSGLIMRLLDFDLDRAQEA